MDQRRKRWLLNGVAYKNWRGPLDPYGESCKRANSCEDGVLWREGVDLPVGHRDALRIEYDVDAIVEIAAKIPICISCTSMR